MAFKDSNYITIQGWMINRMKLKGNELILFAMIFGFSQDDESEFKGSRKYMSEALNVTRPTVDKSLQKLIDLGLIEKRQKIENNVTFNRYKVNLQGVKKLYYPDKETLQGGSKETLHNNTNTNNSIGKRDSSHPPQKSLFPESEPEKTNHFRDSVFGKDGGKQLFLSKFKQEIEVGVDVEYYFNAVKDWSETKTQKKFQRTAKGWIATARQFMRSDKNENKLQMVLSVKENEAKEDEMLKFLTNDYD